MKAGPNIAGIATLVGDPARANMLTALMSGKALTATELAGEAGVTPQTASSHLARLQAGGLIDQTRQGRHRYYRISGPDVAGVLEALMGLAARTGHMRTRTGPADPAMREARVCYDHLAGDLGVAVCDALIAAKHVTLGDERSDVTSGGRRFFAEFGIDLAPLEQKRRPLCRACLDWSERRMHLGGGLGAALLDHVITRGWARRLDGSRVIQFSPRGRRELARCFDIREVP